MLRKMSLFWVVVLASLLCACAQTGTVRLGPAGGFRPAVVSVADIRVFSSEADVPAEFDKLAMVNVRGWQANTAWIISGLRVLAQREGGNAIVLRSVVPKGLFSYSYGTGVALVIKVKPEVRK